MRTRRLVFILFAGFAALTVPAGAEAQTSSPSPARAAVPGAAGKLVAAGEHFTPRQVVDRQLGGLLEESFQAPQGWTDRGEVQWNAQDVANPFRVVISVENPASSEALYTYPPAEFVALPGVSRRGPARFGKTWGNPVPAAQALTAYVQQARGSLPGFRIVNGRNAPELPALREMDASQHPQGVAVRVAYEMGGRPMEEEFSAAYHLANVCSSVPTGRVCETDWGLFAPQSFRAPAGTLDRRLTVFAAILSSRRQNPAWVQRALAVRSDLRARAMQSMRRGFQNIELARQMTRANEARSNASLAASNRQIMALRGGGGGAGAGGSGGRSAADRTDDYLRGVTTLDDGNGGTVQRSNTQQYHWTDGNGSYSDSNDPSYNPNNGENGNWQQMPESQ